MNRPLLFRALAAAALVTCAATLALASGGTSPAQYPPGPGLCCPDTLTILNVQNPLASPHPATGDIVLGVGGIITGFDAIGPGYGFYVQMSNGLPYSGVGVWTARVNKGPGTGFDLHRGDSVVVYAKVANLEGGTGLVGITCTGTSQDSLVPLDKSPATDDLVVRLVSRANRIPPFHVGTPGELRQSTANTAAAPWEGMLVRLRGPLKVVRSSVAGGLCAGNSFLVTDPSCPGPVCDSVFVDGSSLTTYPPPPVGALLDSLQGVFDRRSGGYRVELRDSSDIDIATPPALADAFPVYDNDLPGSQRLDSVMVVFDRAVEKTSAEDPAHYALASSGAVTGAHRLDAPDDNRVVLEIRNRLNDGDAEAVTVSGVKGLANLAPMVVPQSRSFFNGVLALATVQAPDPSYLAGAPCQDRSRFAGAGSAAGARLSLAGTVTAAFGSLYALQDSTLLRSGLWVDSPIAPLVVGHSYLLAGAVQELLGETEGTNNVYIRDLGVAPAQVPAVQSVHVLRDGTCDAAQLFTTGQDYEGMLVTVPRVVITETRPAGTSFRVVGPGAVPPEPILIAALAGNFTFAADSGRIATVTGVLRQSAGVFAIYPRSDADIESFGANPAFSVPLDASKAATSSRDPDIVLGPNGGLFMAWGRNFDQTAHSLSLDRGDHWSPGRAMPRRGMQPALAVGDSGKYCILSAGADSLLFHVSTDGGYRITPLLTTVDRVPTLYPALTAGSAGHLHGAWERVGSGIWYSRSYSGGAAFSAPVPIAVNSLPGESHSMARICASKGDSVYVFWQYELTGEPIVQKVLFSRSLDGGGTFSTPRPVRDEKNPLTSTVKLSVLGDAQIDGRGTLYVMGMQLPGPGEPDSIAFLRSTNGGARFVLVGHPSTPSEYGVCVKSFAVSPNGSIHALVATCGNALYYTRSLDGGATWTPAVIITADTGPIGEPRGAKIILDSTGTPVVVWFGTVGGSTEIYSSRLLN